jgi:putative peptide zinc metalloprotease protein
MVDTALPLPPLRQELGLFPAPTAKDGTPEWTLHDPPANKFFLLGWPAFEILSRWSHGSVQGVVEAVNKETTLTVTEPDVLGMIAFLEQNFLLQPPISAGNQRLVAAQAASRAGWAAWLLKNYLFIRVPLVQPERFLKITAPFTTLLFSRLFYVMTMMAALAAFYLVSHQWDTFLHSFTAYHSLEGILIVGCAIPIAKIAHELGHAITAHRYGCRIPTMGVALVVMTPMLYTDTNEAWKLTSRAKRLAIGIAGMAAELLLALIALWMWLLLPDGPMRGAAFILATTTWIMTIALNASPFMRFDGYFILSDFLRLPNLHQRSFAFGRWWLREWLFGLGTPAPEPATFRLKAFLVMFALLIWIYRLVVFFGIAVMVYRYFFKALGVLLFAVEIGWFIIFPVYKEVTAWWKMRAKLHCNLNTIASLLLLAGIVTATIAPWKKTLAVPAMLSAAREQQVSVPFASMITSESAGDMKKVSAGEQLLQLYSPEMDQQIRQVRTSAETSRWQADQQAFDEKLLSQGDLPRKRLEAGTTELSGLKGVMERLTLRAPFEGVIVARNDELVQGAWLPRKEPMYVIADTSRNRVDAFISERELVGVKVGAAARFIPDALEFGVYRCTVAEIDRLNIPTIDEPFLASTYGGPIAARNDAQGVAIPDAPVFRIRMDGCSPATVPLIKLRGSVHIEAQKSSAFLEITRSIYAVVIREIGF